MSGIHNISPPPAILQPQNHLPITLPSLVAGDSPLGKEGLLGSDSRIPGPDGREEGAVPDRRKVPLMAFYKPLGTNLGHLGGGRGLRQARSWELPRNLFSASNHLAQ